MEIQAARQRKISIAEQQALSATRAYSALAKPVAQLEHDKCPDLDELLLVRNRTSLIAAWQASIARANMADWLTVTVYLLAAALSVRAATRAKRQCEKRDRLFWHSLAGLLVFLGINELLDLQTLLTIAGREYAKSAGLYGNHRALQYLFVLGLTGIAGTAGLAMIWLTRRSDFAIRLALIGLISVGLFILFRASSFHHLDELFGGGAMREDWAWVQEMAGIAVIASAAALYPRRRDLRL